MSFNFNAFNNGSSGGGGSGDITKTYVDTRDTVTLNSAKTYTDQQVEDLLSAPSDLTKLMGYYNGNWFDISKVGNILYVDKNSTETKIDGSKYFPFKTIQSAIDVSGSGDVIEISVDQYNESITINNKTNLILTSNSVLGKYGAILNGTITTDGSSDRIGINNIKINQAFTQRSNNLGTIYIDNCIFDRLDVDFNSACTLKINHCFFINAVTIYGNQNILDLNTCIFDIESDIKCNEGTTIITDCESVNLTHNTTANVTVKGSTTFVKKYWQDECIRSFADTGTLYLLGGTTLDGSTYAPISKIGDCDYSISSSFIYEPEISTLNGNRIENGTHSDQVYDHIERTGYTNVDDTIKSHLDGISGTLEQNSTDIQDILDATITVVVPEI